jgi:hypothetical protein
MHLNSAHGTVDILVDYTLHILFYLNVTVQLNVRN